MAMVIKGVLHLEEAEVGEEEAEDVGGVASAVGEVAKAVATPEDEVGLAVTTDHRLVRVDPLLQHRLPSPKCP